MIKVAVLMGGTSREREISIRSGKNVARGLREKGHEVVEIVVNSPEFVDELVGCEAVFIALHGSFGEDGQVQKILEDIGIPYTGSGPVSSANSMDKVVTKDILKKSNLPTPAYQKATKTKEITIALPLVLKADSEGSSYGVYICHTQQQLLESFAIMQKDFPDFFIEEYIHGPEVTVGVIKYQDKIYAYPILELIPNNEFYDFESKYTTGMTKFIIPARLDEILSAEIRQLAIDTYAELKCEGAIRVDFIIRDSKIPFITEINTIPGMTDQSDLPAVAAAENISFADLVEMILSEASTGKY